jgi:hypothetical protein
VFIQFINKLMDKLPESIRPLGLLIYLAGIAGLFYLGMHVLIWLGFEPNGCIYINNWAEDYYDMIC